ncbi:MAG: hypothetical protein LBT21_08025 [Oscillospiraceae bacterium]|jgi:hypothetical protein|nr:hypothetical protein [Oscillospiraceae bacterium]
MKHVRKLFIVPAIVLGAVIILAAIPLGLRFIMSKRADPPVVPAISDSETTLEESTARAESVFPSYNILYKEGAMAEIDYFADFSEPAVVLAGAAAVARVTVISAGEAEYLTDTYEIAGLNFPRTALTIQVKELLSGKIASGNLTVYYTGGTVSVDEYMKHNPQSYLNEDLEKLSADEKRGKYIQTWDPMDTFPGYKEIDIKTNTEYVFILNYSAETKEYSLGGNAYSIFTADRKNVMTGKTLASVEISASAQ